MPPKRPLIATNVDQDAHGRLRALAEARGVSLRAFASDVLTNACDKRSLSAGQSALESATDERLDRPEGSLTLENPADTVMAVPIPKLAGFALNGLLREEDGRAEGARDTEYSDPRTEFLAVLVELRLVRLTALWRALVEEGLVEAELQATLETRVDSGTEELKDSK